jgi:hypothetical protein
MNDFSDEIKSKEKTNNLNLISNDLIINDNSIFLEDKNKEKIEDKKHNNNNDSEHFFNKQQSIELLEDAKNEKIKDQKKIINNENNKINININNNNFTEEEEEINNIINNNNNEDEMNFEQQSINKKQKDNTNNANDNDNDNDNDNNDDEELPLITLNFISICQCCKTSFDNNTYLPYLLKCGHFFCIKCINEYFTDKNGIKCPSDGLIAKSTSELTLLSHLIPKNNQNISNVNNNDMTSSELNTINLDNNNNYSNFNNNTDNLMNSSNYCPIHKGQKLSHVICDSNEIICVYCAFECFIGYSL